MNNLIRQYHERVLQLRASPAFSNISNYLSQFLRVVILLFRASPRVFVIAAAAVAVIAGSLLIFTLLHRSGSHAQSNAERTDSTTRRPGKLYPTPAQWATMAVEPVEQRQFRSEHLTEGKIAVDEDRATPIFSPWAGRVTKLFVRPGDVVERGQPLFVIEANDTLQSLNDFIVAVTAMNKARSQLDLAQTVEKRHRELYEAKAVAMREFEQARAALVAAENDMRSSEVALEAARNRLRILGKTDAEIKTLQETGLISPETPIYAPISGTIVQRKIGPGQYVSSGSSDPVYVIGDLSTVWLYAYVRETEAELVQVGQTVTFTVLPSPERRYEAKINYVSAVLDSTSRRLMVRATIENPSGLLKPEMFARVSIYTDGGVTSPAIPRDAVIYEASTARVWVANDDKSVELRRIKAGMTNGGKIQVLEGLTPGEKVITKGGLFIDRIAAGS